MEESKRKSREGGTTPDPERVGSDDPDVKPKKKKNKTAAEPSKADPDDPEDKPKKRDKGKSPKKKKSKTAAEPSKTDPDDPEPPKTGADDPYDPEHHKGKRQNKRKEIETTSDPSEIECDVKKLKVDYSPPKSSSSESEYEGICEPMQVGAVNLPEDVTEPELREIVLASGFNNQSTVKEIMKQLGSEFKSRGEVLNIFVPEDNETGGCLGFGYIYIDPQGVDGGDLWKSFEIDGLPITLTKASPKLCFEAEIVGKKKANDEDEKTALKKMLLPLNTSLPTLMYTQRRYSWTDKRPDITAESYKQETNDCWAAALHRAYSALLTLSGSPGPVLTRQDIIDGVDEASGDGIDRLKYAISFMEKYVKEMNIYRRPRGNDASSYEDFESFTLQLLATTPVMVTVECLPGFLSFDGQGIFSPSDMDCRMRTFEKFPIHCLLLTGNDVKDGIEYWKLHETKGKGWGVEGFIMMERHKSSDCRREL